MPWISAADWIGAVQFLISREDVAGPVNIVGPDPVRNKDFTRALGRILYRPTPWPVPKFALRIVLGEFANEVVASTRAVPTVLTRAGYTFQHSTVDSALGAALKRT
jgi:NAD dependent epimerase/dehydratase family enzyme